MLPPLAFLSAPRGVVRSGRPSLAGMSACILASTCSISARSLSISKHLGAPVTFKLRDQIAVARDPELLLEDQLFYRSYSDASFQAERFPARLRKWKRTRGNRADGREPPSSEMTQELAWRARWQAGSAISPQKSNSNVTRMCATFWQGKTFPQQEVLVHHAAIAARSPDFSEGGVIHLPVSFGSMIMRGAWPSPPMRSRNLNQRKLAPGYSPAGAFHCGVRDYS